MTDLATQTHHSPDDVILTAGEVCTMARLSYPSLRQHAEAGDIDFILFSNKKRAHKRYRLSAVKAFLEKFTITKS